MQKACSRPGKEKQTSAKTKRVQSRKSHKWKSIQIHTQCLYRIPEEPGCSSCRSGRCVQQSAILMELLVEECLYRIWKMCTTECSSNGTAHGTSCHSYRTPPENTKQCSLTCPPKIKKTAFTPLLKQLHWLPIQTRIDYKLATLAFRHFDGSLPQYLSSRLDIYQPSRLLRSSNDRLLRVPRWKLKSFGYRSFSYQGPVVWNSLPTDLKLSSSLSSFKSRLKTHLFKKSYSLCWYKCHICYWSYCNDKKDVDAVQSWLLILSLLLLLLLSLPL